jgi:uncharacterized protein (DUF58 family)
MKKPRRFSLKFSGSSKSPSDEPARPGKYQALWDFLNALALLGLALFLALGSQRAVRNGDGSLALLFSSAALLLAAATAIFLVPRIARRVNFGRLMPLSFSITREGGIYILSVLLLSLAAINTGNNLLFLILAMLLAAIITSGIVARISLAGVSVSMQVPENVFEGERVSMKVALRNHKRLLPSFSISVDGLAPEMQMSWFARLSGAVRHKHRSPVESGSVLRHSAYFPLVQPGETRSELVSQSFPRRGRYGLEGYRISTRFPFGFFLRGERVRADGEILVYPAIKAVPSYFHLLPFLPGRLEGLHPGQGENLYSIRKYQPGESARVVDWKATAKTGDIMAREYSREEESKFCLILDTLIDPSAVESGAEQFEKAVSLAASLAGNFSEEGAELEFLEPGEYIPRGTGIEHLYRILRALAVIAPRPAPPTMSSDLREEFSGIMSASELQQALSDKVFKIIITSKARGSFSSSVWRSSHVVYFSEL